MLLELNLEIHSSSFLSYLSSEPTQHLHTHRWRVNLKNAKQALVCIDCWIWPTVQLCTIILGEHNCSHWHFFVENLEWRFREKVHIFTKCYDLIFTSYLYCYKFAMVQWIQMKGTKNTNHDSGFYIYTCHIELINSLPQMHLSLWRASCARRIVQSQGKCYPDRLHRKMCFVERNLQRTKNIATCTVGEKQPLCFNRILHYPDNNPDFPTFWTTSYHYNNKIYQHKAGRATSHYLPILLAFPTPLTSLPGEDNAKQLYQF